MRGLFRNRGFRNRRGLWNVVQDKTEETILFSYGDIVVSNSDNSKPRPHFTHLVVLWYSVSIYLDKSIVMFITKANVYLSCIVLYYLTVRSTTGLIGIFSNTTEMVFGYEVASTE